MVYEYDRFGENVCKDALNLLLETVTAIYEECSYKTVLRTNSFKNHNKNTKLAF